MSSSKLMDVKDVLAAMHSFSRADIQLIKHKATFLLQRTSDKVTSIEDEDWILRGIMAELARRGLAAPIDGNFRIKKPTSFAGFQTQSENVRSILLSCAPDLTAVQCRALGEIAAKCLANYLLSWSVPREISLSTMLRYVSYIPQAIEQSFPGYLASKMLNLVVR